MRGRRINWLLVGVLVLMAGAQWLSCRGEGTGKVHLSDSAKDVINAVSFFAIPAAGVGLALVAAVRRVIRWRRRATERRP